MRLSILFILLSSIFSLIGQNSLQLSTDGRYLQKPDGTPFFYLGDTAWELFHKLSKEEARLYLKNRAEKGFTVIQAVTLAQLGGLSVPNANGDLPLKANDPTQIVEAYFLHMDEVIEEANELGMYVGLLPCWGSYWSTVNGNEKIFDKENAEVFGEFLGKRYADHNIIWILGGDENINNKEEREIIEAMVRGIKKGDKGRHLMTFHPRGPGRSSDYFHRADWLDFNMYQSSHGGRDHDNGLYAEQDLQLVPRKPTLDGEPRYELIPVGFYYKGASPLVLFDDADARQAAYWSVLAGACGHTYGHNSVWQMHRSNDQGVLGAVVPWSEAMDHPGSFQMGHLHKLFKARPFEKLIPSQELILSGPGSVGSKVRAAMSQDSTFAIFYSPKGEAFTIDRSAIKGSKLKEIWFDPRYGVSHHAHTGNTLAIQTCTPPTNGRGNDWILIIENNELGLPMP